jgi:hypothetical protein
MEQGMSIWLYVIIFAIIGVPFVGFAVRQFIKFGRWIYKEMPLLRSFFDNYADNYGIGVAITIVCGIIYAVLRWFGVV